MQSPSCTSAHPLQRRLVKLFRQLDDGDRASLLAFAEFLTNRRDQALGTEEAEPFPQPKRIARPDSESVVAAIRRLSASYYMLDRGPLLHKASSLMAAHVMQGQPAGTVIDELEHLFAQSYAALRDSGVS